MLFQTFNVAALSQDFDHLLYQIATIIIQLSHLNSHFNTFCCHNIVHVRVTLSFVYRVTLWVDVLFLGSTLQKWQNILLSKNVSLYHMQRQDEPVILHPTLFSAIHVSLALLDYETELNKPICKLFFCGIVFKFQHSLRTNFSSRIFGSNKPSATF